MTSEENPDGIYHHQLYIIFKSSPDGKITGKVLNVSDFHFTPRTILAELSFLWQFHFSSL